MKTLVLLHTQGHLFWRPAWRTVDQKLAGRNHDNPFEKKWFFFVGINQKICFLAFFDYWVFLDKEAGTGIEVQGYSIAQLSSSKEPDDFFSKQLIEKFKNCFHLELRAKKFLLCCLIFFLRVEKELIAFSKRKICSIKNGKSTKRKAACWVTEFLFYISFTKEKNRRKACRQRLQKWLIEPKTNLFQQKITVQKDLELRPGGHGWSPEPWTMIFCEYR